MAASRKHRLRPPTSVYAFLKVHMGEAGLAISAIEASPAAAADAASTIYTPVHAYLAHGYALATCGRAGEALGVLERATAEGRRRGLTRYEALGREPRRLGPAQYRRDRLSRENATRPRSKVPASRVSRELEVYAVLDPCDDAIAERRPPRGDAMPSMRDGP